MILAVATGNEDVTGFWLKMAAMNDLKWYSTFFFLIGAILSFADPVTDAFTLAEYYKDNHMRWFKWGVHFMIAPCLVFVMVYLLTDESLRNYTDILRTLPLTLNPFSPAWASFKAFLLGWRGH